MKQSKWKLYQSGDCPNCGNDLLVLSTCPENEDHYGVRVNDEDEIKCATCEFKSIIDIDEGIATVQEGNIDELI